MEICYKRLWKILIDKDLKKKDLSSVAGISQSSVAKMSRGEPVNLEIILKICSALNCDIGDICEAVPAKSAELKPTQYQRRR
jgi:putative transcriptional regulator